MIYFWIAAKDPLGFTVNLNKINGIRCNMLVTMATLQMAINPDLTSTRLQLLKNLFVTAKYKNKPKSKPKQNLPVNIFIYFNTFSLSQHSHTHTHTHTHGFCFLFLFYIIRQREMKVHNLHIMTKFSTE